MMKIIFTIGLAVSLFFQANNVFAWQGMMPNPMPPLHVDGRYLKDPHGNIINLHGYAQTFSPWFNERGTKWNNHDVAGCLAYNKDIIDRIMAAGWKMNFVRMHMDPYWSDTPGCTPHAHELPNCFNESRFRKYLDEVFIPMAEYAISKGLYVMFRPPGVCPEVIGVEDDYNYAQYLLNVWDIVSKHPKINSRHEIMFELANEPVRIRLADGSVGSNTQAHFDVLKEIFQPVVNKIRENGFHNVLWIPGSGYQSQYKGFAVNPIEGENIGYAVHIYPGWFGSANGYEVFKKEWDENVQSVANFAPIAITEMDWAPEKYNASWGKGITGTAGGEGFGANFKKIIDNSGNVSWLLFTEPHLLAQFTGTPPAPGEPYTFLNDPEACPWPIFHWYQDYARDFHLRPEFRYLSRSDNGDGTFANPVIRGDFPAPAVVRDRDTYYLISTNTRISPEITILESKDLIHWSYSNKKVEDIPLENVRYVNETDIHSGTLIETQTGEWWAMLSYDVGPFGKFPHLMPVSWINDDPVIDETSKNSKSITKPDVGRNQLPAYLTTNDNFRHYKLGLQWGWGSNQDNSQWSLFERAGYLRLKTAGVANHLNNAQNTISQRILTYPADPENSFGTIRMEIDHMQEGDVAGLTIFQDTYSFIGVKSTGGEKKLITGVNDVIQSGPIITESIIYFRIIAKFNTGTAAFFYSFDNVNYTKLGDDISLEYNPSVYAGNRFGIFNYATIETGGFVDVDWFSTESEFSEEKYYPGHFEGYTEESLTLTDLIIEDGDNQTVLTRGITAFSVKALFADGQSKEIGAIAEYTNHHPDVIQISRGHIISLKDGEASLEVSYTGPLGQQKKATVQITSSTFPLTNKLFNPNIWERGSFDEITRTLQTGQWGFGGWRYDGINLSGYKYIVVRLGSDNNASVDFRLFDENNYWASPASYSFGNSREIIVMLDRAVRGDGKPLKSENIYIAGFWSNGNNPFVIDTVFLSNSSEYDPPAVFAKDQSGSAVKKLEGFTYVQHAGPSASQSFIVSGVKLTDKIMINSPGNFEISLDETQGYTQSITLNHSDGQVEETTIHVRLKPGLTSNSYAGDLVISSTGALTGTISLSGTVEQVTSLGPGSGAAELVSTAYYTFTGQKINSTDMLKGMYIIREFYSDGSVSIRKIIRIY